MTLSIDEVAAAQQSQADALDALARQVRSLMADQTANEAARLQSYLSSDTLLRIGSGMAPSDVPPGGTTDTGLAPAGSTDPGAEVNIAPGSVIAGTLADFSIDTMTKFASGIRPVAIVAALPTIPAAAYPIGTLVFLTTDTKIYRNPDDVAWIRSADGADIVANSITAGQIQAGAIGATELAASIVLASVISTAASGRRVAMSVDGIILYAADGVTKQVVIPTDGSPVYVNGQILASSLVSTTAAEFGGTNLLDAGSVTTAGSGISSPTPAPSITESIAALSTLAPGAAYHTSIWGSEYDTSDNTIYALIANAALSIGYIAQFTASTGALVRAVALAGSMHLSAGSDITLNATHVFVRDGSDNIIRKYLKSTLALVSSSAAITINSGTAGLFYDGSAAAVVLVDTTTAGASAQIRFRLIDTTALTVSSTVTGTGFAIGTGSSVRLKGGFDDGTSYWVAVDPAGTNVWTAYAWTEATGANLANRDFGTVGTISTYLHSGLLWDGSAFLGVNNFAVVQFTNWDWTTASAKYWVAYSWYDNVVTVHETTVGPRASITMHRRCRLDVTSATIPVGGTDDPNRARVYMLPNATDPGIAGLKLQVEDANTGRLLTTYNAAGAADPATNNFPGGTPAQIRSTGNGWILKGNGMLNLVGTAFPGSPSTDDHFYRSDLHQWFFYNGTRWLSDTLYHSSIGPPDAVQSWAATQGGGQTGSTPWLSGGSDIWVENMTVGFIVASGGTALGAGQQWVGVLSALRDGTLTLDTVATATIASGASNVHRSVSVTVGALLNNGTVHVTWQLDWTKTGTPGNLRRAGAVVGYRIVAT